MADSTQYGNSLDRQQRDNQDALKAKEDSLLKSRQKTSRDSLKERLKNGPVNDATFIQYSQYKKKPKPVNQYNGSGSPFMVVQAKSETRRMIIPSYTEDLSQADYDKAKKLSQNPTVLEAMRKQKKDPTLDSKKLEGLILAEMLKNADPALKQAAGGKEDYDLRSVIGLQNMQSTGERSTYNQANGVAHTHALNYLPTGLTYDELVERGINEDHGVGVMVAGGMLIAWGSLSANQTSVSMGKRLIGMGAGAGTQYLSQVIFNEPGQEVDYKKVALGGLGGGLAAPANLVQSLMIAEGTSVVGDGLNRSNPNAGIAATAVAVPFGYGAGKLLETSLGKVFVGKWVANTAPDTRWQEAAKAVVRRNQYAQAAKSAGMTGVKPTPIPQKPVLNSSMPIVKKESVIPGVAGAVFGSAVNDGTSKSAENFLNDAFKNGDLNEKK